MKSITDGHQQVEAFGLVAAICIDVLFDLGVLVKKLHLQGPELLHVLDVSRDCGVSTKEQLEQDLNASHQVLGGFGQPLLQCLPSFAGEGIHVALWFSLLLLSVAAGQSFRSELLKDRINLPIALVPEVTDALLDELFNGIPRHWTIAEHT